MRDEENDRPAFGKRDPLEVEAIDLKKESDITGDGYGSDHIWKYRWTSASRTSYYVCSACGLTFAHHYPTTPNIFEAMKQAGITNSCQHQLAP